MSNILNGNSVDLEEYAEIFKALSNPNRLKLFRRLVTCCAPGTVARVEAGAETEECACVGDLGKELDIAPSTLSHHLKELRRSGLVRMQRRGQKIECWVDPQVLEKVRSFFF